MSRVALSLLFVAVLCGCGGGSKPTAPRVEIRLLGSTACVPGKPVLMPGSELVGRQVGKKHDAAYAWIELKENGKPLETDSLRDATVRFYARIIFPDGWSTGADVFSGKDGIARIAIPAGYAKKPERVNLEIYNPQGTLKAIEIKTLAEPNKVIRDGEPRMSPPRWKATLRKGRGLVVDILGQAKDSVSIVTLKRTTQVDLSDQRSPSQVTIPFPGQGAQYLQFNMPPQNEVELEETEYRMVTERCRLVVRNLEVETQFDTPVLNVTTDQTVTTKSGFTFVIPKQRLAPARRGSGVTHRSELQIKVLPGVSVGPHANWSGIDPTYSVEKVTPELGGYGIWQLRLNVNGGINLTKSTLNFATSTQAIKTGIIPSITFDLVFRWPKQIAIHKGIVPVTKA